MPLIYSFTERLQKFVLHSHINKSASFCPGKIELLYDQKSLSSKFLYIGEIDRIREITRVDEGCFVFLSAEKAEELESMPQLPESCNWLVAICPLPKLYNMVMETISETAPVMSTDVRRFSSVWDKIITGVLFGNEEIAGGLNQLHPKLEKYMRIALVSFPKAVADDVRLAFLSEAKGLFIGVNITIFRNDILILLSGNSWNFFAFANPKQEALLNSMLIKYGGYFMISNSVQNFSSLCSAYNLVNCTLDIALKMAENDDRHILYYDDFSAFCLIDLCVQRFLSIKNNSEVLCLVHPGIIKISEYDKGNGTNYRKLLHYYLLNNCNVTQTGDSLYMHRNTVLNKIKQIQSVFGLDLEDAHLRQRLMLSCQIMLYHDRFLE